MGHSVSGVGNGAQALDALREADFDLVLMDIQMPVMNGVDAIMAIREGRVGERYTAIPIIALTAYAMAEDEARISPCRDGWLPGKARELRRPEGRPGQAVLNRRPPVSSGPPPPCPSSGGNLPYSVAIP